MDSSTNNVVDMGACSTNQHHETPPLCRGGCGFYATPEKEGLCSKCYNSHYSQPTPSFNVITAEKGTDELGSVLSSLTISETAPPPPTTTMKSRCNSCSKKLRLIPFECRCGGNFCTTHRHPEAHACRFDFKEAGKISIRKQNPLCISDKIQHRV